MKNRVPILFLSGVLMLAADVSSVFAQKFKLPKKPYEAPSIKVSPALRGAGLSESLLRAKELFSASAENTTRSAFDLTKTEILQGNPALGRQIAMQVAMQERMTRLENNLEKLEEYVYTHGNKLPYLRAAGEGADLRRQVQEDIGFLFRSDLGVEKDRFFDVLVKRYHYLGKVHDQQVHKEYNQRRTEQRQQRAARRFRIANQCRQGWTQELVEQERKQTLDYAKQRRQERLDWEEYQQGLDTKEQQQQQEEQFMREFRKQERAAEERAWKEVLLQDRSWKAQPEETADPAESADRAAALGEEQIALPGNVATDAYVNSLLRFYNKLDPFGNGTVQ